MNLFKLRWGVSHPDRQAANKGCRRGEVRLVTFNGEDAICRWRWRMSRCAEYVFSALTRRGDEITEPGF